MSRRRACRFHTAALECFCQDITLASTGSGPPIRTHNVGRMCGEWVPQLYRLHVGADASCCAVAYQLGV